MFKRQWRTGLALLAGIFGLAMVGNAADDAGVEALPDRTFIHKDSKTALKIPPGWTIISPYRLRKTTASTVLGMEKENPLVSTTVIWSPVGKKPYTDFIRPSSQAHIIDEYELLLTVYGKNKVSKPTTMLVGPFTVHKILVDDGPDREGRYAGAVYLFESGPNDNRWCVKIRTIYPALNREVYVKQVEEVINSFVAEE